MYYYSIYGQDIHDQGSMRYTTNRYNNLEKMADLFGLKLYPKIFWS